MVLLNAVPERFPDTQYKSQVLHIDGIALTEMISPRTGDWRKCVKVRLGNKRMFCIKYKKIGS